ncbi:hypothetical protein Tco_0546762 [Tanacetum coccineum]
MLHSSDEEEHNEGSRLGNQRAFVSTGHGFGTHGLDAVAAMAGASSFSTLHLPEPQLYIEVEKRAPGKTGNGQRARAKTGTG